MQNPQKNIIVIDGPQGVGKDAVIDQLMKQMPDLEYLVSYSTRAMRQGEVQGATHHFISEDEFLKKVGDGDIFEYSRTAGVGLRGMGKSIIDAILSKKKIAIKTVDIIGYRALNKEYPDGVLGIFMTAPKELIAKRIKNSGSHDAEARLQNYDNRISSANEYNYIVENIGTIDECVEKIINILEEENGRNA